MSGPMLIVVLVVVVWSLVALVFGLALARVLGRISHGAAEPARPPANADEVEHLARSA
jgi:hypothetical protein